MNEKIMKERIEEGIDNILLQVYNEYGIESGDIDLFQTLTLEKIENDLAILFMELYNQNKKG